MEVRVQVKQEPRLLVSVETAAAILGVTPDTVGRMVRDGRLPSIQLEGTIKRLIPMNLLKDWVQAAIDAQIGPEK